MKLAVFFFLILLPVIWGCPRKEALFPCTCNQPYDDMAYVTCAGLDNVQDLVYAAGSFKGWNSIYSLTIKNSSFNFIPSDAFQGSKFKNLEILGSSLGALTDTDVAFEGLEDNLQILHVTASTLMNEWDWRIFRNLRQMTRLSISNSNLQSIDEDFKYVNTNAVKDINFARNHISYLHDTAFGNFKNLLFLAISNNLIKKLKRSMLPEPANLLVQLDLSYNQIEYFPTDMFHSMPSLESLNIANNHLLVLEEKTLKPVWSQLRIFNAMGNELRCDCRMIWILNTKCPTDLSATCVQPQKLKGKYLNELTSKDLWCYFHF